MTNVLLTDISIADPSGAPDATLCKVQRKGDTLAEMPKGTVGTVEVPVRFTPSKWLGSAPLLFMYKDTVYTFDLNTFNKAEMGVKMKNIVFVASKSPKASIAPTITFSATFLSDAAAIEFQAKTFDDALGRRTSSRSCGPSSHSRWPWSCR